MLGIVNVSIISNYKKKGFFVLFKKNTVTTYTLKKSASRGHVLFIYRSRNNNLFYSNYLFRIQFNTHHIIILFVIYEYFISA